MLRKQDNVEEEGVALLPMDGAPSPSSSEATAAPAGASAKGDASPAAAAAGAVDAGGGGGDAVAVAATPKDEGAGAREGEAKEDADEKPTCNEKMQAEWEALRDGVGKWIYLQYDADGGDGGDSEHAAADAGVVASEDGGGDGDTEILDGMSIDTEVLQAINDGEDDDDGDGDDDDDDDDETCVEQIYGVWHAVCQEVYGFVESGGFQKGIAATILLAALLAGVATYFDEDPLWITILNYVVSWIFVAEMVLKIIGNQPWHGRYFIDAWNVFDFFIVLASFSPDGGAIDFLYNLVGFVSADKTVSKNIKLLRILRLFKLVRNIKGLKIIIVSLVKALEFGKYIALLTVMTMYLFAVVGMMFFEKNDPIMFGTLHGTMITLWQAVTGDDWTEIMYTQTEGCDYANADAHYAAPRAAGRCMDPEKTNFALVTAYFMTVVILLSMMFVNLFVGAILMAVEETRLEVGNEQNLHVHMISGHDVEIADWSLIGEGRSDPYCLIEIAPEWPPMSHDDALCLGRFGVGADYGPKFFGAECTPGKCERRCGKSCATKRVWVTDKHVSSCCRAAPNKDSYRNTKVQKQTLQPVWDEHFDFFPLDKLGSHMLHIQVWDWDMCGGDDPLGDLNIDLSAFTLARRSRCLCRVARACARPSSRGTSAPAAPRTCARSIARLAVTHPPPFSFYPLPPLPRTHTLVLFYWQAKWTSARRTSCAFRFSTPQRGTSSFRSGRTRAARRAERAGIRFSRVSMI